MGDGRWEIGFRMDRPQVKQIWNNLLAHFQCDEEQVQKWWEEIEEAYTETNRHYHNLDHLQHLFAQLELVEDLIQHPKVLSFSIFYHDIIYNIRRKDNELKSAELAQKRLEDIGLPAPLIHQCFDQIVATKRHEVSAESDTNYLLDMDLSILGSSWEVYFAYTKQIRQEYRLYPDFLYKPGRRKVLTHFIEMPTIFKTPFFRDRLEEQAKANLRAELDWL